MNIASFIISIVAACTGIVALIISIVYKKEDNAHNFFCSLNEKVSHALFVLFPSAYSEFLDNNNRTVNPEKYEKLDSFFLEIYSILKTLRFLDEKKTESIWTEVSDLEDCLMNIKTNGYDINKIKSADIKTKKVYKELKDFCVKH